MSSRRVTGGAAALAAEAMMLMLLLGGTTADPQVPCYFIFGDSLVDNGNNNNMASLAVANYPPYGIDFDGGPNGRFTNGMTTVDVIGTFRIDFFFLSIICCLRTILLKSN